MKIKRLSLRTTLIYLDVTGYLFGSLVLCIHSTCHKTQILETPELSVVLILKRCPDESTSDPKLQGVSSSVSVQLSGRPM